MAGLHEVGIPFEEARDMLEGDLMIRRMMMMRVNMKAHRRVGPGEIRKAYQEYILKHKVPRRMDLSGNFCKTSRPRKRTISSLIAQNNVSRRANLARRTCEDVSKFRMSRRGY